ncbi:DUF63 domain-containing protein [Halobacteriales archaeon QH_7_66_36]|nr:MAG: DUF63 domain-containing protein [Halobacteriales archaeon QH_7_66_36]
MPAQLLPTGASLPPLPYLAAVLLALAAVGGALSRHRPPVTPRVVAGFAPWMAAGASGYALFQVDVVPDAVTPLFGNPIVYASTFAVAGAVWLAVADRPADRWALSAVPGVLAVTGGAVATLLVAAGVATALARGSLTLAWPLGGLGLSVALAGGIWLGVRDRVGVTGWPGLLVLFGHTLDGVSTAVGIRLGFGEQTPLSARLIEAGAGLPPASLLGEAWLFVLVKLVVATGVLFVFREYVREDPSEAALYLGVIAAVGLGPGTHNLVLFALA